MQGFTLAFNVVVPLVIYMGIGVIIRLLKLFSEDTLKELNNVIFKVLIPFSLFFDIYSADQRNAAARHELLHALALSLCEIKKQ